MRRSVMAGSEPNKTVRINWTLDQLKLAFYLYCQLPFGKLHSRNPQIIELATRLRRTPSSVAMKLVNFASLDPAITSTGRKGLSSASNLDKEVWRQFNANWEALAEECAAQTNETELVEDYSKDDFASSDVVRLAKQRTKQKFFRKAVLASYRSKCCMSGLTDEGLLIASHIVPWHVGQQHRLNPRNGLCLSALHDKAFDRGLISLTDQLEVLVSGQLLKTEDTFSMQVFGAMHKKSITLPERFVPEVSFLQWHRNNLFVDR